jgi:tetratricopeptide (TPR) repeat protein
MSEKDRYWDCLDQAMEASHGGHTEEALAWLDEALKARPGGAEAHNGRGEILWDEGKIHEALQELDLSTQADPKFLTAHLNRAELLIEEMGEYEQALEQCDRLLSGSPELARPDRGVEAEIYYLKAKALFSWCAGPSRRVESTAPTGPSRASSASSWAASRSPAACWRPRR